MGALARSPGAIRVRGHDIAQFKDMSTQVVIAPAEYKSGDSHLPLRECKVAPRMKITQKQRSRLQAVSVHFLLGILGLASVTFICFQLGFGVARTAFVYVVLVALVSLLGSVTASIALSFIAAACLRYFFAPPLLEFRVDAQDDVVRIALFLTTSVVVSVLTTRRNRAEEALNETKAKLEEAQRIAHVGWWERDFSGGHVALSEEACRIFGVQPVKLPAWQGRRLQLIHLEDRARVAEAAAAALPHGGPRIEG